MILILDLARLGTFLFYDQNKNNLTKKSMLAPVVGPKMYTMKNIFVVCITVPTIALVLGLLGVGIRVRLSDVTIQFLIAYLSLAFISFFLITLVAKIGKKLQKEIHFRKETKELFIIELLLLIVLFLVLIFFNQMPFEI